MIQPNLFRHENGRLNWGQQINKTEMVINILYDRYGIKASVIDQKHLRMGETGYFLVNPSTGTWFTLTQYKSVILLTKINDNVTPITIDGLAEITIAMNIANAMSNRD